MDQIRKSPAKQNWLQQDTRTKKLTKFRPGDMQKRVAFYENRRDSQWDWYYRMRGEQNG